MFDSNPGLSTISNGARAVTVGIKNNLVRWIAFGAFAIAIASLKFVGILLRSKDIFTQMREDLLNPTLIPIDAPRLYIYSNKDQLVPSAHVDLHLQDAKKAGIMNITTRRDTSSHVNHMRDDPAGYWSTIKTLWLRG